MWQNADMCQSTRVDVTSFAKWSHDHFIKKSEKKE